MRTATRTASSAVVNRERADWERCASRRVTVGLVQAGDGPGREEASADRKRTGTHRRWALSSTSSLWRQFGIKHPMTTPDATQSLYGGGMEMVVIGVSTTPTGP